jgi:methionyl aminopeptidase
MNTMIIIKTDKEIQSMRAGGKIHARVLRMVAERAIPGISTLELDTYAEELVRAAGAFPAFKDYKPEGQMTAFPATLCTSINDEIVHGIPSVDRILQDGDIISIDLGVQYQGVFLDGAITVPVGTVSSDVQAFLNDTKQAMMAGIHESVPGNTTGDIGYAIQKNVNNKYGIVKGLAGHGVGREIHEDPYVPNYGKRGQGARLVAGMAIAIEPMLTMGSPDTEILEDDWTFVTADGSLAAHFEHTVLITDGKPEILTVE